LTWAVGDAFFDGAANTVADSASDVINESHMAGIDSHADVVKQPVRHFS
jgi:hypothetical protein